MVKKVENLNFGEKLIWLGCRALQRWSLIFGVSRNFGIVFIRRVLCRDGLHLNDRGADEMGRTIYNHLFFFISGQGWGRGIRDGK